MAVFPQVMDSNKKFANLGKGITAGFIPLTDTCIYWFFTCALPIKGENLPVDPKVIQRELLEKYTKDMPELYIDIMKHSDQSTVSWAPLMFRLPWKVAFRNLSRQTITVAGDAMHPMTPDLGSTLEDDVVLGRHIGTSFIHNGGS